MISRRQLLTITAALTAGAIATPFAVAQSGSGTSGAGVGGSFGYSSGPGMPDSSYTNDVSGDDLTVGAHSSGATSERAADARQSQTQGTSRWGENQRVTRGDSQSRFPESDFGPRNNQSDQPSQSDNANERDLTQTERSYEMEDRNDAMDRNYDIDRSSDPLAARDTSNGRLERRSTGLADTESPRPEQLRAERDPDMMLNQEEEDIFEGEAYAYGLDGQD